MKLGNQTKVKLDIKVQEEALREQRENFEAELKKATQKELRSERKRGRHRGAFLLCSVICTEHQSLSKQIIHTII